MRELDERSDFGFETTLAGRTWRSSLLKMKASGYQVHLYFLWLPDAEIAVSRVQNRVRQGGHHVPVEDIRRRYSAGLRNFVQLYRPTADYWWLYDGMGEEPNEIATGERGQITVRQKRLFRRIEKDAEGNDAAKQ